MKPGRRAFRIGTMMLIIAGISIPLAFVMRAINPPRAKAVVVGPSTFNFSPQLVSRNGKRTQRNHSWVIRNDGTLPLVLKMSKMTQCTYCDLWGPGQTASKALVIQPGQQGTIVQTWRGFFVPARRRESIEIETNDHDNPTLEFIVQGLNVDPPAG